VRKDTLHLPEFTGVDSFEYLYKHRNQLEKIGFVKASHVYTVVIAYVYTVVVASICCKPSVV
jgi:hypothetical protein